MRFLEIRDSLMRLGWDRRVSTLAARVCLGVDTIEGILLTPGFRGPLLTSDEAEMIRPYEELHKQQAPRT
jgi:hypothetical protein